MEAIVPLDIPGHGTVYLETELTEGIELTSMPDVKARLDSAFSDAMSTIQTVATGVFTTMKSLEEQVQSSEYSVEFGVKLSAEVGAMVARAASDATIKVSIKWCRDSERLAEGKSTS